MAATATGTGCGFVRDRDGATSRCWPWFPFTRRRSGSSGGSAPSSAIAAVSDWSSSLGSLGGSNAASKGSPVMKGWVSACRVEADCELSTPRAVLANLKRTCFAGDLLRSQASPHGIVDDDVLKRIVAEIPPRPRHRLALLLRVLLGRQEGEAVVLVARSEELLGVPSRLQHEARNRPQHADDSADLVVLTRPRQDRQPEKELGADAAQAPHVDGAVVRQTQQHFGGTVEP
eukprot:scaffold7358_cov252-Pinguiococcus_pyrenoidosus.AAC.12